MRFGGLILAKLRKKKTSWLLILSSGKHKMIEQNNNLLNY